MKQWVYSTKKQGKRAKDTGCTMKKEGGDPVKIYIGFGTLLVK